MFSEPDKVRNLLHNVDYWGVANDGTNYFVLIDFMLYEVAISAVSALHPELPRAIAGLFSEARVQGNLMAKTKASLVLQSYYLLSQPSYQFTDIHDELCTVTAVRGLTLDEEYDRVEIDGDVVTVVTKEDEYGSYKYVTAVSQGIIVVNCEMLQRQYPGWTSRWEVAESLCLAEQDFMAHVFSDDLAHTPAPSDLTAITFS